VLLLRLLLSCACVVYLVLFLLPVLRGDNENSFPLDVRSDDNAVRFLHTNILNHKMGYLSLQLKTTNPHSDTMCLCTDKHNTISHKSIVRNRRTVGIPLQLLEQQSRRAIVLHYLNIASYSDVTRSDFSNTVRLTNLTESPSTGATAATARLTFVNDAPETTAPFNLLGSKTSKLLVSSNRLSASDAAPPSIVINQYSSHSNRFEHRLNNINCLARPWISRHRIITKRQKFYMFLKVLIHFIEKSSLISTASLSNKGHRHHTNSNTLYDQVLLHRVKSIIRLCVIQNRLRNENFMPLEESIIIRIRDTVGIPYYWNLTRDWLGYECL
jgi:hypothetical protein